MQTIYQLSRRSRARLLGVHPQLSAVVERAIHITTQDFGIAQGLRTLKQQQILKAKGASQTLKSKHLIQADNYGHAFDVFAWNDAVQYQLHLYYPIALAIAKAAEEVGVKVRWGGCWAVLSRRKDPEQQVDAYIQRKHCVGKKPFIDAMHFELYSIGGQRV